MKESAQEMPAEGYGCAVANRFGRLLDDESDPFDLLYEAEQMVVVMKGKEPKKRKEEPKKSSPARRTGGKESARDRKPAALPSGGGEMRGEVVERRVSFERKSHESDSPISFSVERPVDVFDRAGRGRANGRGRGARGPAYFRSTDGFNQRGKREFERHSGSDRTSVRSEEKRGGSGSRNWGSVKDHMSEIEEGSPSEEVGESEETPEAVDTDGENRPSESEEVFEVAIEMTLDEWKALQEQSRPKVELNIRKADAAVPSKAVVIHKSKFLMKPQDDVDEEDVVFRRPVNDITRQLEINFGSLARPSRGGGGARGGRGGRGRGAPSMSSQRSPQTYEVAPNPDDPEDFPALG